MSLLIGLLLTTMAVASTLLIISLDLGWLAHAGLLLLALGPLALLTAGLRSKPLASCRAGAILTVPYVGFALTEVVARPEHRWLPALLLVAAAGLTVALIGAIRRSTGDPSPPAPDG